jgi:hypothetical protein
VESTTSDVILEPDDEEEEVFSPPLICSQLINTNRTAAVVNSVMKFLKIWICFMEYHLKCRANMFYFRG